MNCDKALVCVTKWPKEPMSVLSARRHKIEIRGRRQCFDNACSALHPKIRRLYPKVLSVGQTWLIRNGYYENQYSQPQLVL